MSNYYEEILCFEKIIPSDDKKGITDDEYRETLEWLLKFNEIRKGHPFKSFTYAEVDAISCILGKEQQYPDTCYLWPGLNYRECEIESEKLRIAYEKCAGGIVVEGVCETRRDFKYRDFDMINSEEYWKIIRELASDEVCEGCHRDSPEDYESFLDFALSCVKCDEYADFYLEEQMGVNREICYQIQSDVIDEIKEIVEELEE